MQIRKNKYNEFIKFGFTKLKIPTKKYQYLKKLKLDIKKKFKSSFQNNSFENFHKNISDNQINSVRVNIIKFLNTNKNLKKNIYLSLKEFIDNNIGPDVIIQKNINLGIQMPLDENRPLFHKDTPLSSHHEIVAWIPLVDSKKSMSMYLIPREYHDKADKLFSINDEKSFRKFSLKHGKNLSVKFGEVLIFCTNNFHYVPLNQTNMTRWSLNLRFKNLFSPYGERNLLDYYEIVNTSPLTEINSENL